MRERQERQKRMIILRRVAAVLIVALIPIGAWQWQKFQGISGVSEPVALVAVADETGLFDDEVDLWELALMYGNEENEAIDDLALIEVSLWDEVVWQSDDLLGKELEYENHNIGIIDVGRGHRLV